MNPLLKRLHQKPLHQFVCVLLILASLVYAQTAPIPDPAALLKEVQEQQHKTDIIRENYTFHELIRTDTLDDKGVVKETKTEESEIFFVNGHKVIRLVKKDGAELNASDQKKEQDRVKKEIDGFAKAPREIERGRGGGRDRVITRLLAVAKASNVRRLTFRDRPTLVFDFTGDPKAKADGMDQNAARKVAGTIWVDEADRQIARFEIHFYDNFSVGGFLAKVQKGTSMAVDQSPLGEGLWMQVSSEDHVEARLVVKNYRLNVHIQDFDFKRFDIGTKQQIGAPATPR